MTCRSYLLCPYRSPSSTSVTSPPGLRSTRLQDLPPRRPLPPRTGGVPEFCQGLRGRNVPRYMRGPAETWEDRWLVRDLQGALGQVPSGGGPLEGTNWSRVVQCRGEHLRPQTRGRAQHDQLYLHIDDLQKRILKRGPDLNFEESSSEVKKEQRRR